MQMKNDWNWNTSISYDAHEIDINVFISGIWWI